MMVGSRDQLSSKPDYEWLREKLGSRVCYFREFNLGH